MVLGAGTDVGVAGLVPDTFIAARHCSEGGHASLPTADDGEAAVIAIRRQRLGRVSRAYARRRWAPNLYGAIAALNSSIVPERDAVTLTR